MHFSAAISSHVLAICLSRGEKGNLGEVMRLDSKSSRNAMRGEEFPVVNRTNQCVGRFFYNYSQVPYMLSVTPHTVVGKVKTITAML